MSAAVEYELQRVSEGARRGPRGRGGGVRPELANASSGCDLNVQTDIEEREIADTAGVGDETVRRDLETTNVGSPCDLAPPATITNSRGQQRPTSYRPKPSVAPTIEDAVREFPDLAHYAGFPLHGRNDLNRISAIETGRQEVT